MPIAESTRLAKDVSEQTGEGLEKTLITTLWERLETKVDVV
jgi:hypothetical protein